VCKKQSSLRPSRNATHCRKSVRVSVRVLGRSHQPWNCQSCHKNQKRTITSPNEASRPRVAEIYHPENMEALVKALGDPHYVLYRPRKEEREPPAESTSCCLKIIEAANHVRSQNSLSAWRARLREIKDHPQDRMDMDQVKKAANESWMVPWRKVEFLSANKGSARVPSPVAHSHPREEPARYLDSQRPPRPTSTAQTSRRTT